MKLIPFIGGMLRGRARQADPQETLNLYVRKDPVSGRDFLFGMPGLTPFFGANPESDTWDNPDGSCVLPVLQLVVSSTYWCIEARVLSISSDGLTITVTRDYSTVYPYTGGQIVFQSTAKTITGTVYSGNKVLISVASAFSGLSDGDAVGIETQDAVLDFPNRAFDWMGLNPQDDYPTGCLGSAIYYCSGNCWPFALYHNASGSYVLARSNVPPTFVYYDCYDPTASVNIRITDDEGNNSNALTLSCTATATWDVDNNPETMSNGDSAQFGIASGIAPYTITISGTGWWLNGAHTLTTLVTSSPTITVYTDVTACGPGTLTLTDACGGTDIQKIRSTFNSWWREYRVDGKFPNCQLLDGWFCGPGNDYDGGQIRIQGEYKVRAYAGATRSTTGPCGSSYCDESHASCCFDLGYDCLSQFCLGPSLNPWAYQALCHADFPFTICLTRAYTGSSGFFASFAAGAATCVRNRETWAFPQYCWNEGYDTLQYHPYCGLSEGDPPVVWGICDVQCYCMYGETGGWYKVWNWECIP